MNFPEYIYVYHMRRDIKRLEIQKYIPRQPESVYNSDRCIYYHEDKYGNKRHLRIKEGEEGVLIGNSPKRMWLSKRDDNYARALFHKHFDDSRKSLLSKLDTMNEYCNASMFGKIISEEEA